MFKVGDRVKLREDSVYNNNKATYNHIRSDCLGTIVRFNENRESFGRHYISIVWDIRVYENFEFDCNLREIDIEHERYKYTRLAEILYPNGKKDGDWWILK